jgi:hypothetical protein
MNDLNSNFIKIYSWRALPILVEKSSQLIVLKKLSLLINEPEIISIGTAAIKIWQQHVITTIFFSLLLC